MSVTKPKKNILKSQTLILILERLKEFELALKLSSQLNQEEILLIKRQFKKILKTTNLKENKVAFDLLNS